mgnify:CR=1 FL=1
MLFPCSHLEAFFPGAPAALAGRLPLSVSFDCHDRPPFILRAAPLVPTELPEAPASDLIRVHLQLTPAEEMLRALKGFAAAHSLVLEPPAALEGGFQEQLLLAASHLAESRLFIFSERAVLTCRLLAPPGVELEVTGPFQARRLPCQETDLILHLEAPAAARWLSWLYAAARRAPAV